MTVLILGRPGRPCKYVCDYCRDSVVADGSAPGDWATVLVPGGPHHFCATCRENLWEDMPAGVTIEDGDIEAAHE